MIMTQSVANFRASGCRLPSLGAGRGSSTLARYRASEQPEAVVPRRILKGPCVVEIVGRKSIKTPMNPSLNSEASLQNYMEHASEHFANMQLPLGGEISCDSPSCACPR